MKRSYRLLVGIAIMIILVALMIIFPRQDYFAAATMFAIAFWLALLYSVAQTVMLVRKRKRKRKRNRKRTNSKHLSDDIKPAERKGED